MNPVLRWLDDPPKLFGFTGLQWVLLVFGGGGLGALLHFGGVPLTPSACLLVLVAGIPAMFVRLSDENAGINVTGLLRDAVAWRRHPHHYDLSGPAEQVGLVVAAPEPRRRLSRSRRVRSGADRAGGAL